MEKILSFAEVSRILEHDRLDPFLCDLRETGDGKLYILICRATAASEPEPDKWEIVFEDYILYQVRNESFCSFAPEESRTGKYLAVFETSKLLEYLPLAVDARLLEHTSPWKHYAIFTQDQIIDVIASKEPVIYQ